MIRPLLERDLPRIKEIDAASFPPEDRYDDATYALLAQSDLGVVAVDVTGAIAGYALVQRLDDWPWAALSDASRRPICQPHSHVRSIAVHPAYRNRGFGRAMLRSVVEHAQHSVDLLVDETNEAAVRLYESLGFEPAEICAIVPPKRRMVFYTRREGLAR